MGAERPQQIIPRLSNAYITSMFTQGSTTTESLVAPETLLLPASLSLRVQFEALIKAFK